MACFTPVMAFAAPGALRLPRLRQRVLCVRPRALRRAGRPGVVRMAAVPGKVPAARAREEGALPRQYTVWRWRVFVSMVVAYSIYYVTRFSFPFAAPMMQTSLGLSLQEVGIISSCFPIVYGVAKLFGGVVADLGSPRIILAGGLMLAALCNLLFGLGSSVPYFAVIWALNGVVSSVGFPCCAKLMSVWYAAEERGKYWGLCNMALNFGGAASPIIVGTAASMLGWRFGLFVPALIAFVVAILAYIFVRDSPRDAGLPPIAALPSDFDPLPAEAKVEDSEKKDSRMGSAISAFRAQLIDGVLSERAVWNLGAAYFFVYIIRQGLTSWSVFYLMQARGVTTLAEAAMRVSGLELGGLLGSITSGWLSDVFITRNPTKGVIGQRVRVILIYLLITVMAIAGFYFVPITTAWLPVQWLLFAVVGLGLYGPQLLVGLSGAECVNRRFAGTSNGFVGFLAYIGAALAGYPLSICVKHLGWNSLFVVLLVCCALIALLVTPLLNKRSYEQNAAEAANRRRHANS